MSPTIALLTRNNFIAAMLAFHLEFDGVKSVLTIQENFFKALKFFDDDNEVQNILTFYEWEFSKITYIIIMLVIKPI